MLKALGIESVRPDIGPADELDIAGTSQEICRAGISPASPAFPFLPVLPKKSARKIILPKK